MRCVDCQEEREAHRPGRKVCRQCQATRMRAYRKRRPEVYRAHELKRRNRPERIALRQKWRLVDPERYRAYQAAYQSARYRQQSKEAYDPRVVALYAIARWLRLRGDDVEVDHVHPLSKGGRHVYENLQILSRAENRRKAARIP